MRWLLCAALALYFASTTVPAAQDIDNNSIAEAVQLLQSEAGDHRLLLLGEKHGTREIPNLVAELVRAYAEEGPVLLGLEIHRSEQGAMRRYMESDGGVDARAALRASPFWVVRGVQHDGRRSHDMLDLVEQVRVLRSRGRVVDILPYDLAPGSGLDYHARDEAMAATIREALAEFPRGRLLILAGNVHAMLQRPAYAPEEMQTPMGSYLRDLEPYSTNITARGGEFWACMKQCGPMREIASARAVSGRIEGDVYNLQIVLPTFSVAHLVGADSPR